MKFEKIESIDEVEYCGDVYDLEVEDDHSYIADGYVVHNCITSSNTGIHDGIVSLLTDISKIKNKREDNEEFTTKVIADGGIRGYSDVIKALALGADYVMIGGLLSKTIESASALYYYTNPSKFKRFIYKLLGKTINGKKYLNKDEVMSYEDGDYKWIDFNGRQYKKLFKEFYGMASKYGQIAINGKKTKTSEGIKKEFEVSCNLETWANNMADYLKSAMSYCDIRSIKDFNPHNVNVHIISNNEQNAINK